MLTRRTVLKSIISIPIVLSGSYLLFRPDYLTIVERAVYNKLDFLALDPEGVKKFSKDFIAIYNKTALKVISIDIAIQLNRRFTGYAPLVDRIQVFEDFVVSKYLISSDYFVNNQSQDRLIKYRNITLTAPYLSPCSNPFAKFIG